MLRRVLFSMLGMAWLVATGLSCDKASSELSDRCRALGSNRLQSDGLQVYVGSRLDGSELSPGELPSCAAHPRATQIFLQSLRVLDMVPEELRPERVTIHLSPVLSDSTPPIDVSEVHKKSRSILVDAGALERLDTSTLLHELAHVQMAAFSPSGVISARLTESLEEGIADYFAATIQGSPLLGRRGEKAARDLAQRPIWLRGGWTRLARAEESWTSQDQGWALAALLWSQDPTPGPLLRDLVSCVKSARGKASESPGEVIEAWLAGCPTRSRETIEQILHRWIPSSLY